MASFVQGAAQWASDTFTLYTTWSLPASLERLEQELQKNPQCLRTKFYDREDGKVYTLLEYAVRLGDPLLVREAFAKGAEPKSPLAKGSIAHFYIDCCDNLISSSRLELLLKDPVIDSVNGSNHTVLEHALLHMLKKNQQLQADVIELLLSKGISIGTSFAILKTADYQLLSHHLLFWSVADERYFTNLVTYLDLEKKYHPETPSSLTHEEFAKNITGLRHSLDHPKELCLAFCRYQKWYNHLVKEQLGFRKLFDEEAEKQLRSMIPRLKEDSSSPAAKTVLQQLTEWGWLSS